MTDLPDRLPRHVAIIMDGNGRWARARALPRVEGHRVGFESAREIAECCLEWSIPYLTLFAFSTENWKRPQHEVSFLMSRLSRFLRRRRREYSDKNVRLRAIGRLDGLPQEVRKELAAAIEETRECTAMTLTLALNYGGRQEIAGAAQELARRVRDGRIEPEQIDVEQFERVLDTAGTPDPDLMIRTGGEYRLSNFLLWQLWYAELYVTETCWPQFRREQFLAALREYARRERRFGGLADPAAAAGQQEE